MQTEKYVHCILLSFDNWLYDWYPDDWDYYEDQNGESTHDKLLHLDGPGGHLFEGFTADADPDVHREDGGRWVEDGGQGGH